MNKLNEVIANLRSTGLNSYANEIERVIAQEENDSLDFKGNLDKIKSGIKAPYVSAFISSLGGSDSLMIKLSLDEKNDWSNNIFENSQYMGFHISSNGIIELFTEHYKSNEKFKKSIVKNIDEIISKINDHIEKVKKTNVYAIDIDDKKVKDKILSSIKNSKLSFTTGAAMYVDVTINDEKFITFIIYKHGDIELNSRSKKIVEKPLRKFIVKNEDEAIKKINEYIETLK
jgi:hypothetical protein